MNLNGPWVRCPFRLIWWLPRTKPSTRRGAFRVAAAPTQTGAGHAVTGRRAARYEPALLGLATRRSACGLAPSSPQGLSAAAAVPANS